MVRERDCDVAVVGAGPAGLTAALLMARAGLATVLFSGTPAPGRPADARTTALMQGAARLLDNLGLWAELNGECAALRRLRLIDDTDWKLKAPSVSFDCAELGSDPFGWNVPNDALIRSLAAACTAAPGLAQVQEDVVDLACGSDRVLLHGSNGTTVCARLVAAADGRTSICRDAAGIQVSEWSYPQTAIACSFSHDLAHDDTSIEFHKTAGPLTLVPLPGARSSLVWVTTPQDAADLLSLPHEAFESRLHQETHGILGEISASTARAAFPIKGLTARRFAARRIALIGEAGHVLPPIGAQGLNLGLRDAALLSELAADAVTSGEDIAGGALLEDYDRRRRLDVLPRTALVDFLNRSLFSGIMPLHGLRGLGLFLLDTVGPLRRAVMRQGMEPQANLPALMRRSAG